MIVTNKWINQPRFFAFLTSVGQRADFDFLSRWLSLIVFISAFWAMGRRVNVFDIWNSDLISIFTEPNGWPKPERRNWLNFIKFENLHLHSIQIVNSESEAFYIINSTNLKNKSFDHILYRPVHLTGDPFWKIPRFYPFAFMEQISVSNQISAFIK